MKRIFIAMVIFMVCNTALSAQNTAGVEQAEIKKVEVKASTATIRSVQGSALVLRKGSNEWLIITPDAVARAGDQISVGSDSLLIIDVNGNDVLLEGPALLNMKDLSSKTLMKLFQGKVKAKIKKLSDQDVFEIMTPVAVCAVRGTEFEVEVGNDNATLLKTIEGSVFFKEIITGREIAVPVGKQSLVRAGQPPTAPASIPSDPEEKKEEPEKTQKTKAPEPEPAKEKPKKTAAAKPGLGINGSFGADVLMDPDNPDERKVYYSLSLLPEISFWKIGVGLDINVYFDEEGNVRNEDWDGWDDLLEKVWYIRYGQSGDPLYALIGGIKGYSLGHGFIMSNYTNMLNYPDVRRKGLIIEVDAGKMGFQSVLSDIDSYPVIGGRLFYRPFSSSALPFIGGFGLGVTGVTDQNPDSFNGTEDDDVLFYGADCEMPLLNISAVKSLLYLDYASYSLGDSYPDNDAGSGTAFGLGGSVYKFIQYSFEYRRLDNNFEPRYFGAYYEVERDAKPLVLLLSDEPVREGPLYMLGFDMLGKAGIKFIYEDYNRDTSGTYPYFHGRLDIHPSMLMDKISFAVSYDNKNVEKLADITELEGAIMITELGYMVAPNIMLVMIQKQSFDSEGRAAKTMTMRTRFRF